MKSVIGTISSWHKLKLNRTISMVLILIAASCFLAAGCTTTATRSTEPAASGQPAAQATQTAKSCIFLIGDGMGPNQVMVSDYYLKDTTGKRLTMDTIKTRGLCSTHSLDSVVTDSAAAVTALMAGHKTNNKRINTLPDERKLYTLGQAARDAGKSVGVVTTSRITHATPAGVYAHHKDRDAENEIGEQLVDFAPEVVLGGGYRHFIPQEQEGSKRKDSRNLLEEVKTKGYTVVNSAAELKSVDTKKNQKLWGLFSKSHLAYEVDRVNQPQYQNEPSLAEMTSSALEILGQNPKGFFIQVEGARIDHACHAHDPRAAVDDTIAFDEAIKVALDYQQKHPDTLVIVTGDHECGGMGMGMGKEYAMNIPVLQPVKCSLEHMGRLLEKDPGKIDEYISSLWGLQLSPEEHQELHSNLTNEAKNKEVQELSGKNVENWAHFVLSNLISQRSRVGWTSYAHTAAPVVTYAVGPGAEMFAGFHDNIDIAKWVAAITKLTFKEPY